MENGSRAKWSSRSAFILAAVGSAVGLGNAWRFPGLCAKYGGGAFLLVYLIAGIVLGVPLLMMEFSLGRHMRSGAPGALRGVNKKLEWIGWSSTANAFFIVIYYAVVFAWVIMMAICSYRFAGMTGDATAAGNLWTELSGATWSVTEGIGNIPTIVLISVVVAWALIYYCIRNGAHSVSKVVKYTVTLPILCLVILAIRGLTMSGAGAGMAKLFIPDFASITENGLWSKLLVDAVGQVFYSLSIMMAAMIAYSSYLDEKTNLFTDALIIAVSDTLTSVIAAVVMFSTMYGVGYSIDDMSASGILTAFFVYPTAIVNLTSSGVVNAIFGFIFYFCLCTLAIDSAFSLVEGVSAAISDKFKINPKKTTITVSVAAALLSLPLITGAGAGWVDIIDNWTNQYNLVIVGVLEALAVGWFMKTSKVLTELNRNTHKLKMPGWWFCVSIKFVAPLTLAFLVGWNLYQLFGAKGGSYGYPLWAEIVGGWAISVLVFASGFIIKAIVAAKKKKGFVEDDRTWDDMNK